MALPQIASHDEWLAARTELLAREKEMTRARDALNAERRRLPMERVETDYRFQVGAGGAGGLDRREPAGGGPCPAAPGAT